MINLHFNLQKLHFYFTENQLTIHDQQSFWKIKFFIQYCNHWLKYHIIKISRLRLRLHDHPSLATVELVCSPVLYLADASLTGITVYTVVQWQDWMITPLKPMEDLAEILNVSIMDTGQLRGIRRRWEIQNYQDTSGV